MYKSFKLLIMTVNVNGGENETIEHLYVEKDGKLVPMTKDEAELKMLKDTSSIGGNPATKAIRAYLFNPNGDIEKFEEVVKEA